MKDQWVFGVEARDGAFFCTAMSGDGTVKAMRVFPSGRRGVAQFLRFAGRQGPVKEPAAVGFIDRMSVPGGGEELAEALRAEGFQVCAVSGESLAGPPEASGLALDGGRNSCRAARALLQPGHPVGGRDG